MRGGGGGVGGKLQQFPSFLFFCIVMIVSNFKTIKPLTLLLSFSAYWVILLFP